MNESMVDPVREVFGMTELRIDGDRMAQSQDLSGAVADHRGMIEIPSYAVLVDSVAGGPCFEVAGEPVGTVTSRLAMSAGARIAHGGRVNGRAEMLYRDDAVGSSAFTIAADGGTVVCMGNARTMCVGGSVLPPAVDENESGRLDVGPGSAVGDSSMPPPISAKLDGRNIITGIGSGDLPAGPLGELLNLSVGFAGDSVTVDMVPQPWMANSFGTMHGGVIAAAVAQASSFAGQARTSAGQDYRLADVTVNFFRSPDVDGSVLTISTGIVRIGRRIGTFEAQMRDAAGKYVAHGLADVHFA